MHKHIWILFIIFGLGCTADQNRQQAESAAISMRPDSNAAKDFNAYLESLDEIPLPFKHGVAEGLPALSKNYDPNYFEQFKHAWTSKPLGRLISTDQYIATIESSVGDYGMVPFIITYDLQGQKIDSLGPYRKSGFDMGYEAVEYLQILDAQNIIVTDSVKQWKLNEDETDIVKGTMRLSMGRTVYRIQSNGKFEQLNQQ